MKRVHNDPGSSGGSPPAPAPATAASATTAAAAAQPAKGRKRKSDASDAQTPASRKSSQKSTGPKETKMPAAKPLLDQWVDHRRAAEDLLRSLSKPDGVKSLHQISEMKKVLDAMSRMTNTATPADMAQLAGHLGFTGTG